MSEPLSRVSSGKQIPAPSLVSCTSHHKMILGEPVSNAKLYAIILESGSIPEKPPRATAKGASPTKGIQI